jgi:hypothetical protein
MPIYNKIYDFCKVRNNGNIFKNGKTPTPRVEFLLNLLESLNINYDLDEFPIDDENMGFNINLPGNSDQFVVAHHDINNPYSENANDNSCSIINCIAVKILDPSINVCLLDGEEFGGYGSEHLSKRINNGDFGNIRWILNLELSGAGGKNFFIGNHPGPLSDRIISIFGCPVVKTPFNDSFIFNRNGIDSTVINPLPVIEKKSPIQLIDGRYLDYKRLFLCHSMEDTTDKISPEEMKEFVEEVILKIISKNEK